MRSPWVSYVGAAVLGLFAFIGLGLARVNGFATYWDIPLGDAAQALNAISLFAAAEGWQWPLLSFWHPGRETVETIILADGIPLYANLVKVLAGIGIDLPLLFTWRLLTAVGQAVAMAWLLRACGVRRLDLLLLGCGLALMMPAFLFRGHANHLALSAHAVAIAGAAAAIALRTAQWASAAAVWSGLLAASLLVHPYFLAMNAGLFAGWLVQRGVIDRAFWTSAVAGAVAVASVGLVSWVGGYIQAAGSAGNVGGFGHYSMNLLGPWAVTQGGVFPGETILDATGGQYEGYSYLGLAPLGLLAGAIVSAPRAAVLAVRRHAGTSFAALGLTVFALSDQVYLGGWHVADLSGAFDRIPVLPETFRASGRMVWPVLYLLLAAAVARAGGWWPARQGHALLAGLAILGVQAADVRPMAVKWLDTPVSGFNAAAWRSVLQAHRHLALYPPSGCTETDAARFINPEYAYAAYRYGLTTNSFPAEIARGDCPRAVPALENGRLAAGTLYVFHASIADYATIRDGPGVQACRRFHRSYVCSAQPAVLDKARFLDPVTSPVAGLDLAFGRRYPLRAGEAATAVLAGGWYAPEPWGTWSRRGAVRVLLPPEVFARARAAGASAIRLEFGVRAFIAGDVRRRRVVVASRGERLATWVFAAGDGQRRLSVSIPTVQQWNSDAGPVPVTLTVSGDISPAEDGRGADARSLGVGVSWLRVMPLTPSTSGAGR